MPSFALTCWQWIALPLALPAAWALSMLLGCATRAMLRRFMATASAAPEDGLVAGMVGPITLGWFLAIAHAVLPWLALSPGAMGVVRPVLHALVLVGLFWTLLRVVDAVAQDIRSSAQEAFASRGWVPLAARLARLALVGAAAVLFLYKLGYPVAAMLAGLGIGVSAVVLAAPGTFIRGGGFGETKRSSPVQTGRDVAIDALRGLAVFTMVGANMVPYMLDQPYPWWLRFCASLAAPAFILLAGFMVGHSHIGRPAPFTRHLKRAFALLLVAALIDVLLWGEDPFSSFDVLYLIALVPPAAHLVLRFPRVVMPVVVAVIFLATPLLQTTLGYETEIADPGWARLKALAVDGWFPVFPWLGVGILGAALGAFRQERGPEVFGRKVGRLGTLLLASGVAIWWVTAPEHRAAGGFAELFYPPTLGVLFATLGLELWLLVLLVAMAEPGFSRRSRNAGRDGNPSRVSMSMAEPGIAGRSRSSGSRSSVWHGLAVYGRAALALYVVHLVIIAFVIKPWFDSESLLTFVVVYLAHAVVLWWLALAIRRLCPVPRSFWSRLLLGS